MPVIWDDAKEKQLLLLILHHTQPSPPWAEVAKGMGEECSVEACKQKLKKLKAAARTQFGEPTAGAEGETTPKTPAMKGKKAAVETPAKSSSKRKSKKDKEDEEAKSEEPNDDESPAKKLKTENGEDSED